MNIIPYCHRLSETVEKYIPFVSGWVSAEAARDEDSSTGGLLGEGGRLIPGIWK